MMYRAVSVYWISVLLVPSVGQQMSAHVAGGTLDAGRLEILINRTWVTVCGNGFGQEGALVACRMLGFNSTTAVPVGSGKYGQGSSPVLLGHVECQGNETSLAQCNHSQLPRVDCDNWEDVGIICNTNKQMAARLADGTSEAGRLEIFFNGEWGTVCGQGFGSKEAQVACSMLRFNSTGAAAISSDRYGPGAGPVLLQDVKCQGTESSLAQCKIGLLYPRYCDHRGDVGVVCNMTIPLTVRLHGGSSEAGRLEILINADWNTVCHDGVAESETKVACNMLGFNRSGEAAKTLIFGSDSGFQFRYMKCKGMETSLEQCEFGQLQKSGCFDVGILCDIRNVSLRLTGPRRTDSNMGRVEVKFGSNQFSTMCVNDEKTAAVICRQLNLTSGMLIDSWLFGGRTSPVLEVTFVCDGNEKSIAECRRNKVTEDCYSNNAGVACSSYGYLYIVSENDMYPFMEGTKGSLKCVTSRKYRWFVEYTWSNTPGGRPQQNLLIFNNLTREHNGHQVGCQTTEDDFVITSAFPNLKVYYRPLITITWADNTGKQQPLSNLSELNPGHNVTLWCEADSNPPPASITWSGRVNSTTGELRIIAAEHVTHSGLYTCTVVTHTVDDDDRLPLTSSYQLTLSLQGRFLVAALMTF